MAKALADIRSLARAHTDSAIKVLAGIMTQPDAPHAARVAAANSLLDRGWGKPTQPVSGDDDFAPIRLVSDRERAKAIAAIVARAKRAKATNDQDSDDE